MTNAHPKLRTTDRDMALMFANRWARETGRRHRVTIEKPDVPAKGIAYLVDEVQPVAQQIVQSVDDSYLRDLQTRINSTLQYAFLRRLERA